MNMFAKLATAAAVAGALAVPMATPSQAGWHHGNRGAAAAIGFGAGAVVGAAAATAAYGPGYGYGYDSYAYEPGPAYDEGYVSGPTKHNNNNNNTKVREHRCMLSPGNPNYVPCDNKF